MTPEQISLVEADFRSVLAIRDQAAVSFYANVFRRDPSLRRLFGATDMAAQGGKLMASLGMVVRSLPNPAAIAEIAVPLAARHRGYGVTARDYDVVGAALLDTLEEAFGDAFTPAHARAWARAYAVLAAMMVVEGREAA